MVLAKRHTSASEGIKHTLVEDKFVLFYTFGQPNGFFSCVSDEMVRIGYFETTWIVLGIV